MLLKTTLWDEMQSYLFLDAKLSDKTGAVQAYKSVCLSLLKYFSSIEFTRNNFSTYLHKRQQAGNKKQTLDNHLKMAKHIDKFLSIINPERKRIIEDYGFFKDKSEHEFDTLTVEEVSAMINVKDYKCNEQAIRDKAIVAALSSTAGRPMEVLGLKWGDLQDKSGNYSILFRDTKNNTDRRIPIVREDIWQILQALPRISNHVFPSDTDKKKHMGNPQLGIMLKRRAEALGIKKRMEPYIFRRTWLTLAIQSGMPIMDAQKIMGHRNLNTTVKYYNSNDEQQRKAMMQHKLNRADVSFKAIKAMARERLSDLVEGTNSSWNVLGEGEDWIEVRISRR